MTMITPSYLGETIEYSSLHACRSTLEDPTHCGLAPGNAKMKPGAFSRLAHRSVEEPAKALESGAGLHPTRWAAGPTQAEAGFSLCRSAESHFKNTPAARPPALHAEACAWSSYISL